MKIRVHDFNQIYTELMGIPYCGTAANHAIIVGKDVVVLTDHDANHSMHSKASRVSYNYSPDGTRFFVPISYLLSRATAIDDVELQTFIRTEVSLNDYHLLLESIKLIGLDPVSYMRYIGL